MYIRVRLSRIDYAYPLSVSLMCGIIGYTGQKNTVPILITGLYALEYRGYDSSGISFFEKDSITTVKAKGRISEIESIVEKNYTSALSHCGIGHTRWATHGEPSDTNSHPHYTENISLVHNGIIENYEELKERLSKEGYSFVSETDTEAALKLIDSKYKEVHCPYSAIRLALSEISGSYAFAIMFRDFPGKIFAVKKDNPLIVAKSEHGSFLASDIPAVLKYTNTFIRLDDGELAVLEGTDISFTDASGNIITKIPETAEWSYEQATKDGFPHFMLKEIHEEPDAVKRTLSGHLRGGLPDFGIPNLDERLRKCKKIHIVACGTAMHAGLFGKYFIEKYTRIPTEVEIASEFRYRNPILTKDDIFIALSQSGETADTLAALRLAKNAGLYTLALVNVAGSSLAREADGTIYTFAGPEIAVASTKAYTVQVCCMFMLAVKLGLITERLTENDAKEMLNILISDIPDNLRKVLSQSEDIKRICKDFCCCEDLFFIGRGADYALATEASLKLKEISYIHCEAYAAGEMKHGTISLITEGTSVIALVTEKELYAKMLSNIKEVKSRGAHITVICDENLDISPDVYDEKIEVPFSGYGLTGLCAACAFQLLAYHTAVLRECDVDKPRNLAKSVTVE